MASRLAVIAVLLAAVAGCSRAVGTSPPPDEIRIAIPSDIRGTNPGVDRDAITDAVLAHVVEGLVAYDENFHVAPMLADTYEVSSDGTGSACSIPKPAFSAATGMTGRMA